MTCMRRSSLLACVERAAGIVVFKLTLQLCTVAIGGSDDRRGRATRAHRDRRLRPADGRHRVSESESVYVLEHTLVLVRMMAGH